MAPEPASQRASANVQSDRPEVGQPGSDFVISNSKTERRQAG